VPRDENGNSSSLALGSSGNSGRSLAARGLHGRGEQTLLGCGEFGAEGQRAVEGALG
jgi:hypothetical protein